MCGIAGFVSPRGTLPAEELEGRAAAMALRLAHRGPDDAGQWSDPVAGVGLGHRRLSIVDLSPGGRQPMVSACGRYVTVFNGEIYNHAELRGRLEAEGAAPRWRGGSDTEVLLAAVARYGVETALGLFVGMFAFALWDRAERTLVLARDRLGEKPLYYGFMERDGLHFLFGSELKALRAHPAWRGSISRDALALFFRHNYVPCPYSIYESVWKLPPGTLLHLPWDALSSGHLPEPRPYWSARRVAETGTAEPFSGTEEEAVHHLDRLLRDAVGGQMVADVPLGAFLSGGWDSTAVVAAMQAQSASPVKTFSIGFTEEQYDEARYARAVARHLGTDHTELYVSPAEAMEAIPLLPNLYDEPFADSSQIPTWLVSRLARRHVTVSLSGDGGDELFGGYTRYLMTMSIWRKARLMPRPCRQLMARALQSLPQDAVGRILRRLGPVMPASMRHSLPEDKLRKFLDLLSFRNIDDLYLFLVSHWKEPAALVPGASEPPTAVTDPARHARLPDFLRQMMYLDLVSYLPDDIMTKVDRASMGVSLEARAPFLDHRLVEFAWRLPLSMKIQGQQGKRLLRLVVGRYVPPPMMNRPKMGFGVPIGDWLRGALRGWADDLLDEERMRREGLLDPGPVMDKWREHLSGRRNWQYHLWDILMFQAWLRQQAAGE